MQSANGSIPGATSMIPISDYAFLGKRFTGLLQLTYSLVIAYGMFITLVNGERRQFANILLSFCLFIIVGCLLETYGGLRPLSDAVRERIYPGGNVYDSDLGLRVPGQAVHGIVAAYLLARHRLRHVHHARERRATAVRKHPAELLPVHHRRLPARDLRRAETTERCSPRTDLSRGQRL